MRGVYILGILAIVTMSCNCSNNNYARAVKKDTERIFKSKKSFIQSLAFKGVVNSMKKCDNCNINKFTVFIQVEELNKEVLFQDEQYPPYYSFNGKILSLTVNKEVFDTLKKGDTVNKKSNSRYLEIGNRQLEILHKEELIWLP